MLSEDPRTEGVPLPRLANDQVRRVQGRQAISGVCVCLAKKSITRDWWHVSHTRLSFLTQNAGAHENTFSPPMFCTSHIPRIDLSGQGSK